MIVVSRRHLAFTGFTAAPSNRYLFGGGFDRPVVEDENTFERLEVVRAPDMLCVEADDDVEVLAAPLIRHIGARHCIEAVDEAQRYC